MARRRLPVAKPGCMFQITRAMDTSSPLTIALVDSNVAGHHSTYMRLFAQTLLDAGHRVIALRPEPEKLLESMKSARAGETRNMVAAPYLGRSKCLLWPKKLRYWAEAGITAGRLRKTLNRCEKTLGAKCDFVFFNDLQDTKIWLFKALADACELPWSFLYVHTASLPPHSKHNPEFFRLMRHPNLKAFAVLDERSVTPGERLTGRKIVRFPDFTDETLVDGHPLEKELQAFKGTSPLVLAIGHLREAKGFTTLLATTLLPSAKNLKFAFIGECRPNRREWEMINGIKRANPNVLFRFGRLSTEAEYNACINAADVLFAAYHDFAHSSNTLTKAAVFEKPVVVSDGHLMAGRTREHRLGEIVRQKDPADALAGIQRIAAGTRAWVAANKPDWQGYRALHSQSSLAGAFGRLLEAYR